jgi:hypothetical protein
VNAKRPIQSRSRSQLTLYHPYPLISEADIPSQIPILVLKKPILPGVTETCFIPSDVAIKINKRREKGVFYIAGFARKDPLDDKPVSCLSEDTSSVHSTGL